MRVESRSAEAYIIRPLVRLFCSPSRLVLLGAMDYSSNAASAELVVLASPPSTSPLDQLNEKAASSSASSSSQTARWSPYLDSAPAPVHSYPARSQSIQRSSCCPASSSRQCCQRSSGVAKLQSWFPIILYAITSFAFIIAIAFYKNELFQCKCSQISHSAISHPLPVLDDLSLWLRSDENYGQLVLFFLIFLTTIRECRLYLLIIPSLTHLLLSACTTVFDTHRPFWLHIRRSYWRRHLLLCSSHRRRCRLCFIALSSSRLHRTLAELNSKNSEGHSRHRKAPKTPLPHPSSSLSL